MKNDSKAPSASGVTRIATTFPLTGGIITSSGTIGLAAASSNASGYLSSADWSSFSGKQDPITLTTLGSSGPATFINDVLNIPQYSGGSGITSINSLTVAAQTLSTDTTGTDFTITSSVNDHKFSIPDSSAIARGLLTSTDWSTFNGKIGSLNTLTATAQTFAIGSTGTNFNIISSASTHTFNIPDAGASARGLVTTGTQTLAGGKTFSSAPTFSTMTAGSILFAGASGLLSQDNSRFFWDNTNKRLGLGTNSPAYSLHINSTENAPQLYVTTSGLSTRAGINHATNTGFGLYIGGTLKWSNACVNVYGGSQPEYLFYNDAIGAAAFCIDGDTNNIFIGNSSTQPTAYIHIKAGTSTAGRAPLKLTSGTNLTTAETGAIEYNGTNLFFTRTALNRETVFTGNAGASAPTTAAGTAFTNYYGANITNVLGTPNSWTSVVIGGTTYKIPLYT